MVNPPTIKPETFLRSGAVGEVEVCDVDEGCGVFIYATSAIIPGADKIGLVGSRMRDGIIILDFSAFMMAVEGGSVALPLVIFALTSDLSGNKSLPSAQVCPIMVNPALDLMTINDVYRSEDGTSILFTPSGMPEGVNGYLIIWKESGALNFWLLAGACDVELELTHGFMGNIDPAKSYDISIVGVDPAGVVHICPNGFISPALGSHWTPAHIEVRRAPEILYKPPR